MFFFKAKIKFPVTLSSINWKDMGMEQIGNTFMIQLKLEQCLVCNCFLSLFFITLYQTNSYTHNRYDIRNEKQVKPVLGKLEVYETEKTPNSEQATVNCGQSATIVDCKMSTLCDGKPS